MAQNKDRKYVNGLFAKRFWQQGNSQLFSIGIKKDEFIRNLSALQADEKGFVNLVLGSQKADPEKMSLWLNEQQNNSGSRTSTPPPSSSSTPPPDDDDLPF